MEAGTEISGQEIIFEPSPKRVRVLYSGQFIADSKNAHLLLPGGPPYYFFPEEDVRRELLAPSQDGPASDDLGKLTFFDLKVGGKTAFEAAWRYDEPVGDMDLRGFIAFSWEQMDAWFEENEPVYVHPHDPYKRIDVRRSSRHIEVIIGDEKVADSHSPSLLFETGLPVRYYLPPLDVRPARLPPAAPTRVSPITTQ